jgi:serine/threonine protein kinase
MAVTESAGAGPTPGLVLGQGRYRLVRQWGWDHRGSAQLWQGRDLVLNRDVALTLLIAYATEPQGLALIRCTLGRALRAARLEQVGAARVLDVLEPQPGGNSVPLMGAVVSEWTPGSSLMDLLRDGPLPPAEAASVLLPLAAAVDAAHKAGLVLGCDHPDRIRVTPDGHARLAFPGPHPSTGSRDDIRGLGAMLYLLLTGYWPVPDRPATAPGAPTGADGLPVSPQTLQPRVPVELATLALRSLTGPGSGGGVHTGTVVRQVLERAAASADEPPARDPRQAQRQRKIKLGVSMTVLAAATLTILGYTGMEVVSVFTNAGGTPLVVASTSPPRAVAAPPPVALTAVPVRKLSVYDPSGLGAPDHQRDLGKMLDGNPNTWWSTDSYVDQFPLYKKGLGVMLSFDAPVSAASLTVLSPTPGTVVEIRTAPSPSADLDQTTLVGTATLTAGRTEIPLRAAPATRYLLVWITKLSGSKNRYQSKLSEIEVQQRAT